MKDKQSTSKKSININRNTIDSLKNNNTRLGDKILNKYLFIGSCIALFIILIPILFFCLKFRQFEFSVNPEDWTTFSEYIAGTSGTLLSFFAVIFSLVSIYFTTSVAKQIQDNEFQFNEKQAIQETKRLVDQNKPYPFLFLKKHISETSIVIQNKGLGPLIITKWRIDKRGTTFSNFKDVITFKDKKEETVIFYNTAPTFVLSPNDEIELLKVVPTENTENEENYKKFQKKLRSELKETTVYMNYEDLFETKYNYEKDLSFFNEDIPI